MQHEHLETVQTYEIHIEQLRGELECAHNKGEDLERELEIVREQLRTVQHEL
jgi:hypothetical protein